MKNSTDFDVIVVGSGPSGSLAAYHLAKAGISTAIVEKDKLPRYKTCGGGLVFRAKKLIPFDVGPAIEREFFQAELYFAKENRHFSVKRPNPIITMTMRDKLDHHLVRHAVDGGAELLDDQKVVKLEAGESLKLTTTKSTLTSGFIIAADGALSIMAKLGGWKESRYLIPALEYEVKVNNDDFERLASEVRFDIDAIPKGYAWSFPKRDHLSIGVASSKRGKVNLKEYYKGYLDILGIKEVIDESQHGYQIPLSPRKEGFVKNNILLTGDAAGFADPVTAEGISNAIFSGQLAAQSIIEGALNPALVDKLYHEKLKSSLLPQLKIGRFLGNIMYDKPWLRKQLFKQYGQRLSEALTDVFMGEKEYPHEAVTKLKSHIKSRINRHLKI